ncbi:hypothetical protein EVAR_86282_1 [Eumeta japonica]|uniref:Uncharacterized protein n=1 Tax=Eumeta variegata TaxID=151549 RepID=A0A4C1UBR8_EUMVA|nr:hypothetical protein EVAR_86282_1 [Eumeta japonica]
MPLRFTRFFFENNGGHYLTITDHYFTFEPKTLPLNQKVASRGVRATKFRSHRVIPVHDSQTQRSHPEKFIAGLLGKSRISDRGGSRLMEGGVGGSYVKRSPRGASAGGSCYSGTMTVVTTLVSTDVLDRFLTYRPRHLLVNSFALWVSTGTFLFEGKTLATGQFPPSLCAWKPRLRPCIRYPRIDFTITAAYAQLHSHKVARCLNNVEETNRMPQVTVRGNRLNAYLGVLSSQGRYRLPRNDRPRRVQTQNKALTFPSARYLLLIERTNDNKKTLIVLHKFVSKGDFLENSRSVGLRCGQLGSGMRMRHSPSEVAHSHKTRM